MWRCTQFSAMAFESLDLSAEQVFPFLWREFKEPQHQVGPFPSLVADHS